MARTAWRRLTSTQALKTQPGEPGAGQQNTELKPKGRVNPGGPSNQRRGKPNPPSRQRHAGGQARTSRAPERSGGRAAWDRTGDWSRYCRPG